MLEDYAKARKLGLKQVERAVAAGRYPYPPALDDILKNQGYQGEVPATLAEIDLSLIAGTKTRGRQNMFSSGFLPIAEPGSEFAAKWSDLIESQRAEGLRIYHEFTRFYRVCPIYGIISEEEGEKVAGQSLNYWWGMSAGVLDVRLADELPRGQRMLVDVLRQSVLSGRVPPFTGELRAQGGDVVQGPEAGRPTSEQIVRMRWLNENAVGRLPEQRELDRDGLVEVEVAGVIPVDPATVLLRDTSR